jgi:hypothetical protein
MRLSERCGYSPQFGQCFCLVNERREFPWLQIFAIQSANGSTCAGVSCHFIGCFSKRIPGKNQNNITGYFTILAPNCPRIFESREANIEAETCFQKARQ